MVMPPVAALAGCAAMALMPSAMAQVVQVVAPEFIGPGGIDEQKVLVHTHGALMVITWVLLIPLGALLAHQKWILKDRQLWGKDLWFRMHVGCQLLGLSTFIAGLVISFGFLGTEAAGHPGGATGQAHAVMGYIVIFEVLVQLILGAFRPKIGAPRRPMWFVAHRWFGFGALLFSWITIYLGIYISHVSPVYQLNYTAWLVPITICMGIALALDICLSLIKPSVLAKTCEPV
ncbi:hypothetical protein FOA52_005176 [Chlamydomonas sp. UWO 241]|nr:hypothetical protein FOA52_005176 [Chlamydomonas sp. UWO 241]